MPKRPSNDPDALKECPFCGVIGVYIFNERENAWKVSCEAACSVGPETAFYEDPAEAAYHWNLRRGTS